MSDEFLEEIERYAQKDITEWNRSENSTGIFCQKCGNNRGVLVESRYHSWHPKIGVIANKLAKFELS